MTIGVNSSGGRPVWDQVLAFGEYQHVTVDGDPVVTVFDASKCRFMLDDFAVRKNDIFVDKRHEVAEATNADGARLDLDEMQQWAEDGRALAWADALCMVVAGQIVKYVRHASAPEFAPSIAELRRPDGAPPEDGVYARRFAVTPLGDDPQEGLPVYRYTSPYFVPMRDGWRLLNYTATNDPRMEGVALGQAMRASGQVRMEGRIAMSRNRKAEQMPAEEKAPDMNAAVMKAAGIAEDDAPDVKMSKMAAYAAKCEEGRRQAEEARKKMDDEASSMKRKMEEEEARRKAEDEEEERRQAEDKPFAGKETPEEEKKEHEAMGRRLRTLEEKNAMLERELRENRSTMESVKKFERGQQEQSAKVWAGNAIAMGRIKPDHKGSVEETAKWLTGKYLKDPTEAEDLLSAEGTFAISEPSVMKRLTAAGAGINQPMPREDELATANSPIKSLDRQMNAAIAMETKKLKAAGKPAGYDAAVAEIKRSNRKLYDAYMGRN